MGGKRIAEQVRRALVAAAKTGTVVATIDASGCGATDCAFNVPTPPEATTGGTGAVSSPGAGGAGSFDPNAICPNPQPPQPHPCVYAGHYPDSGSAVDASLDARVHDAAKLDGGRDR